MEAWEYNVTILIADAGKQKEWLRNRIRPSLTCDQCRKSNWNSR